MTAAKSTPALQSRANTAECCLSSFSCFAVGGPSLYFRDALVMELLVNSGSAWSRSFLR
jgi:hypothetical protein